GVVIVEPGILGKQFFYINGIQIYSYYKDFPELAIGDEISIKGIISQSRGEKRIKTKTREDIRILNRGLAIEPVSLLTSDVNRQELVARLVRIKGQVIEKTGQRIFVDPVKSDEVGISPEAKLFNRVDDDTGEIIVYIKQYTLIDKSRIKEGDQVEITGILSQNNDELWLLPRSNQDIQVIQNQKIEEVESLNYQILASSAELRDFNKLAPYFIISAIILAIIFIILLFLYKRS
ncbi:hypothetical protein KKG58_01860, partial [Patescibacteria group bacterium]|nr:hypothetical protein [Patescibacteria group bacterium]